MGRTRSKQHWLMIPFSVNIPIVSCPTYGSIAKVQNLKLCDVGLHALPNDSKRESCHTWSNLFPTEGILTTEIESELDIDTKYSLLV